MRVEINDDEQLAIYCSDYDLCTTCKNKYKCPLIQALRQEIVILHYSDVAVGECGLYSKRKIENGKNQN